MKTLNKIQKQLLKELEKKWSKNSNERFGQFLFNHTRFGTRVGVGVIIDPFHYRDEEILEDLINNYEKKIQIDKNNKKLS